MDTDVPATMNVRKTMCAQVRITSDLAAQVDAADSANLLDVIVELDGGLERAPDIVAAKQAFSRAAEPVAEAITNLGGEVLGDAWINHTLRARVPARDVSTVAHLDRVTGVDVPHALEPE
jgi:hypothetical protein